MEQESCPHEKIALDRKKTGFSDKNESAIWSICLACGFEDWVFEVPAPIRGKINYKVDTIDETTCQLNELNKGAIQ